MSSGSFQAHNQTGMPLSLLMRNCASHLANLRQVSTTSASTSRPHEEIGPWLLFDSPSTTPHTGFDVVLEAPLRHSPGPPANALRGIDPHLLVLAVAELRLAQSILDTAARPVPDWVARYCNDLREITGDFFSAEARGELAHYLPSLPVALKSKRDALMDRVPSAREWLGLASLIKPNAKDYAIPRRFVRACRPQENTFDVSALDDAILLATIATS